MYKFPLIKGPGWGYSDKWQGKGELSVVTSHPAVYNKQQMFDPKVVLMYFRFDYFLHVFIKLVSLRAVNLILRMLLELEQPFFGQFVVSLSPTVLH